MEIKVFDLYIFLTKSKHNFNFSPSIMAENVEKLQASSSQLSNLLSSIYAQWNQRLLNSHSLTPFNLILFQMASRKAEEQGQTTWAFK